MSRPRTAGSVRYDPYWKVQWWDERSLTWRDIQKAYQDPATARRRAQALTTKTGNTTRLMRVTMEGRSPEPARYEKEHP